LTLIVTIVSFVILFTVCFSSMYSSCDLSTGIFYTNIWMDMDGQETHQEMRYQTWRFSARHRTRTTKYKQEAQLRQRYCAAGWVSFGQKWKTGTERQYFADTVRLSSTTL